MCVMPVWLQAQTIRRSSAMLHRHLNLPDDRF
jgi:hypothetical protein